MQMENLTNEEILAGGILGGISIGVVLVCSLIWLIFQIIAMWKIFNKADKPGWHSIIPILNVYDLFDICWKGVYGILMLIFAALSSLASNYYQQDPSSMLMAVSAGAVFMGANTYIGNAPNFMVKSIAEENKIKMPSFFGYMAWSLAILEPIFLIDMFIWFW